MCAEPQSLVCTDHGLSTIRLTPNYTHAFTSTDNLASSITYTACFWIVGETGGNTQTQGEHADSTKK